MAANLGTEWVSRFCDRLEETGLAKAVLWKVNCRPDEIERSLFARMKACGLYLVYLGIESGTDAGLRLMNKRLTTETSVAGVDILKEIGIQFDFGFMLFEPESTYESVLANVDFLERICGDGSSPVTFCKMLPYAETKIEQVLTQQGRLKGRSGFMDYDFRERSLNYFYGFLADSFNPWIGSHEGILSLARWARYHLAVAQKYFPETPGLDHWAENIRELIRTSNYYVFDTIRALAPIFARGDAGEADLESTRDDIEANYSHYKRNFNEAISRLEGLCHKNFSQRLDVLSSPMQAARPGALCVPGDGSGRDRIGMDGQRS